MGNLVMKYRGQAVEVKDRNGRVYRGVIDGVNQQRGMFLRTGFRRRFIPFFLIAAIFLSRGRRRIF
jgi:small nuclear ribonucleoprotein (snRNP)-like protein